MPSITSKSGGVNAGSRVIAYLKLFAVTGLVVVTWLILLPRVGQFSVVDRHIQQMQKSGIEVDAMFYTELNWKSPDGLAWRP